MKTTKAKKTKANDPTHSATIRRGALLSVLQDARALGCETAQPTFAYVRFDAEPGALVATAASCNDTWLRDHLPAVVDPEWQPAYIRPTRDLCKLLRHDMLGDNVTLTHGTGELTLTCATRALTIDCPQGYANPEMPDVPDVPNDNTFTVGSATLADLIRRAGWSCQKSNADSNYFITGAWLRVRDGSLALCSTDGVVLAYATAHVQPGLDARALIHADALAAVRSIAEREAVDFDQSVFKLALSDEWIAIATHGGQRIVSRRCVGAFPKFTSIISPIGPLRVAFDSAPMMSALAFIAPAQSVVLDVAPGTLTLSSVSAHGAKSETLPVEYDGPAFTAAYDLSRLASVIANMSPGRVVWATRGNESRLGYSGAVASLTHFYPDGRDDHTCVLMPVLQ